MSPIPRPVAAMIALAEDGSVLIEPLTPEARARLYGNVLRLPVAVKDHLLNISHPDRYPPSLEGHRRIVAQVYAKIWAVFELLERDEL